MIETPTSSPAASSGTPTRTTTSSQSQSGATPNDNTRTKEAPRYRQSSFFARWRLRLTMLGMLVLPFLAWKFADASWAKWSFPLGVLASVFGVIVRLWAAGWLRKHEALATDGPYGWVRHPLYAGTGLVALGQGLMSGIPLAAVGFPLFWLLLYRQAIGEEEAFLCEKYPDDYQNFRRSVPALVPLPWRRKHHISAATQTGPTPEEGTFSWSQAWCNREYEGVLLNVVAIAIYGGLYFLHG